MVSSSIAPTTDKPPRRTAYSPPQSSTSGTLGKLVGCLCLVAGIALGTIILATFFLSSAQRRSPPDVNAAAVSGSSASSAHLRKPSPSSSTIETYFPAARNGNHTTPNGNSHKYRERTTSAATIMSRRDDAAMNDRAPILSRVIAKKINTSTREKRLKLFKLFEQSRAARQDHARAPQSVPALRTTKPGGDSFLGRANSEGVGSPQSYPNSNYEETRESLVGSARKSVWIILDSPSTNTTTTAPSNHSSPTPPAQTVPKIKRSQLINDVAPDRKSAHLSAPTNAVDLAARFAEVRTDGNEIPKVAEKKESGKNGHANLGALKTKMGARVTKKINEGLVTADLLLTGPFQKKNENAEGEIRESAVVSQVDSVSDLIRAPTKGSASGNRKQPEIQGVSTVAGEWIEFDKVNSDTFTDREKESSTAANGERNDILIQVHGKRILTKAKNTTSHKPQLVGEVIREASSPNILRKHWNTGDGSNFEDQTTEREPSNDGRNTIDIAQIASDPSVEDILGDAESVTQPQTEKGSASKTPANTVRSELASQELAAYHERPKIKDSRVEKITGGNYWTEGWLFVNNKTFPGNAAQSLYIVDSADATHNLTTRHLATLGSLNSTSQSDANAPNSIDTTVPISSTDSFNTSNSADSTLSPNNTDSPSVTQYFSITGSHHAANATRYVNVANMLSTTDYFNPTDDFSTTASVNATFADTAESVSTKQFLNVTGSFNTTISAEAMVSNNRSKSVSITGYVNSTTSADTTESLQMSQSVSAIVSLNTPTDYFSPTDDFDTTASVNATSADATESASTKLSLNITGYVNSTTSADTTVSLQISQSVSAIVSLNTTVSASAPESVSSTAYVDTTKFTSMSQFFSSIVSLNTTVSANASESVGSTSYLDTMESTPMSQSNTIISTNASESVSSTASVHTTESTPMSQSNTTVSANASKSVSSTVSVGTTESTPMSQSLSTIVSFDTGIPPNASKSVSSTAYVDTTKSTPMSESVNTTNSVDITESSKVSELVHITESVNSTISASSTESVVGLTESTNMSKSVNITESDNTTESAVTTEPVKTPEFVNQTEFVNTTEFVSTTASLSTTESTHKTESVDTTESVKTTKFASPTEFVNWTESLDSMKSIETEKSLIISMSVVSSVSVSISESLDKTESLANTTRVLNSTESDYSSESTDTLVSTTEFGVTTEYVETTESSNSTDSVAFTEPLNITGLVDITESASAMEYISTTEFVSSAEAVNRTPSMNTTESVISTETQGATESATTAESSLKTEATVESQNGPSTQAGTDVDNTTEALNATRGTSATEASSTERVVDTSELSTIEETEPFPEPQTSAGIENVTGGANKTTVVPTSLTDATGKIPETPPMSTTSLEIVTAVRNATTLKSTTEYESSTEVKSSISQVIETESSTEVKSSTSQVIETESSTEVKSSASQVIETESSTEVKISTSQVMESSTEVKSSTSQATETESTTGPKSSSAADLTTKSMILSVTPSPKITSATTGIPTELDGTEYCGTEFCKNEGTMLCGTLDTKVSACDNFYNHVCSKWRGDMDVEFDYTEADDVLSRNLENRAWVFLKGVAPDRKLQEILKSLGLEFPRVGEVSTYEVLKIAGTLLHSLGIASLVTVGVDRYPDTEKKILSLDEADLVVDPLEVHQKRSETLSLVSGLACRFLTAVQSEEAQQNHCDDVANVVLELSEASSLREHLLARMYNYTLVPYQGWQLLQPFLAEMKGAEELLDSTPVLLLKNLEQLNKVKVMLTTTPGRLYRYLGFQATVYLSPFLKDKQSFWASALYSLSGQRQHDPPKWRLCLHLVDRLLPGLLMESIRMTQNESAGFREIMADVMAEEIRQTFIEKSETMKGLDPWTKNNVRYNAQNVGVYSLFAPQFSSKGAVEEFANQVNSAVPWKNESLDYFLGLSKFVAAGWMEPMRTLPSGERRRYSVFDTSCQFNAQKNAVLIPMGFFNTSIPTSAKERMFHIPRVGPRLATCLFQAVFEENFYHPNERLWTIASNEAFKQIPSCLSKQYGLKRESWMIGEIEANAGLAVAYQVFQDRLFTKRYLRKDYSLQGCDQLSSNQLFFVYFAMSYCEHSTHKKSDSMRKFFENRVNVPVMNSREFADAFSCQPGTPMNPTTKCPVLL